MSIKTWGVKGKQNYLFLKRKKKQKKKKSKRENSLSEIDLLGNTTKKIPSAGTLIDK